MKKHLFRFLFFCSLMTLLLFHASAAETACDGCVLGTFNGRPACMEGEWIHLCKNNFPDEKFLDHLKSKFQTRYPIKNGLVSPDHFSSCGFLSIPNQGISDLTGIEFFKNIRSLNCSRNYLTQLDVSNNSALTTLYCESNDLSALDLSNNLQLEFLNCSENKLIALDLSANTKLTSIYLGPQVFPSIVNESETVAVDLAQLIGRENLDRVSGITFDKTTGFTNVSMHDLDSNATLGFDYLVPTANQPVSMRIQIKVLCQHNYTYKNPFHDGACSYCGTTVHPKFPFDSITVIMFISLAVCIVFLVTASVFIRRYRKVKTY